MRRLVPLAASLLLVAPVHAQSTSTSQYGGGFYVPVATTFGLGEHGRSDYARASMALAQARYSEASRLLARLADGSFDPQVQLMTGYASLGEGNARQAGTYFERALRLDNRSVPARHGLALAAFASGDRASAAAQLAELTEARGRSASGSTRAVELDRAIASLRRVIG